MRADRRKALLFTSLFALLAAVLVGRVAYLQQRALVADAPVIVAKGDIPAYMPITANMVESINAPAAIQRLGVFTDQSEVIGRITLGRIPAGVPILRAIVAEKGQCPYERNGEQTTIALPVAKAHQMGAWLRPGLKVDLWAGSTLVAQGIVVGQQQGGIIVTVERKQVVALMEAAGRGELWPAIAPSSRAWTPVLSSTSKPTATPTPTETPTVEPTPTPYVLQVRPDIKGPVNVRQRPDVNAMVIHRATAGDRFTVIGEKNGWVMVYLDRDERTGWIKANLLETTP